jgi:hypothetical protein
MKIYGGSGGITSPILTSVLDRGEYLHAPAAVFVGNETPVSIGQEVGWAPDSVWTFWNTELSYHCLESKPELTAVAISSQLSRLLCS